MERSAQSPVGAPSHRAKCPTTRDESRGSGGRKNALNPGAEGISPMNRHHHGQLAPRRAGAPNARARALPLPLPSETVRTAGRAVGSLLLAAVLGACGDVGIPEPLSSEAKSLESGETGRCQPGLLEFEELVIGRSSFGELASNAVLDVAVHPTSGRIIVAARNGISTSTDGGRTWRTAPARVRGLQRASLDRSSTSSRT